MIELRDDALVFSFPEVHEAARFRIDFQRTLRIPDDGDDYPLPPGLGRFPVRHVDDFAKRVPEGWLRHGGVMLPMYQSEATWLNFSSLTHELAEQDAGWSRVSRELPYPFAVKIATGKINAVSGETWEDGLDVEDQDYVVIPKQPWLDGYCVEKGVIRQFVAMPLGAGYSAEEQITGAAEHGGLQVIAYPMKAEAYDRRLKAWRKRRRERDGVLHEMACYAAAPPAASPDMGLAPGGRMRQEIYDDPYDPDEWDRENASRCFVHLANSLVWRAITGSPPPTTPPTAREYTNAGLPWFEYYSDAGAREGSGILDRLKSVLEVGKEKGDMPLPENESVAPERVVRLRQGLAPGQVRE
ncbi:MAG: hypothetical protein R3266_05120, partial [Gemmatimonadota bacterium]|nr:hypothetical protein [Gemmatimonadota bacterium]